MSAFILISILTCFSRNETRCAISESRYIRSSRIQEMHEEEVLICKLKPLKDFDYANMTNCKRQKVCSVYGIENSEFTSVTQSCTSLAKSAK